MIEANFDTRTLANMTVALNCVCDQAAPGEEHQIRKRVARQIIKCARSGKTNLVDLIAAGRRGLIVVVASTAKPPAERRAGLHRP